MNWRKLIFLSFLFGCLTSATAGPAATAEPVSSTGQKSRSAWPADKETDLEKLFHRMASGDRNAAVEIVTLTQNDITGIGRRILRDEAELEEFRQDLFLKLWNSDRSLLPTSGHRSWFLKMAFSLAIDLRRKAGSQKRRGLRPCDFQLASGGIQVAASQELSLMETPSSEFEPLENLIGEEGYDRVQSSIDRLSPRLSETLRLRLDEGLEYTDIANRLGIPVGTVQSRLNQAKVKLREFLSP